MNCLNCEKPTENPRFCSRSCSASFNNRKTPKRKLTRKCSFEGCDSIVKSYRHRLCEEHFKFNKDSYRLTKVGHYRNLQSVKGKHPSWVNAHVRHFARTWLKHLTEKPCLNCGYSLHVELCHIKPVASYGDEALLGEINSEDNVIQLCRNCHWEFDNGHLTLDEIKG